MKTILRNFLSVLKRFRIATLLNIFGLTIAFGAFILLMIQVNYDLSYNKSIRDSERIMRLEYNHEEVYQAIINRPLAEMFFDSSPYIEAGAIVQGFDKNAIFEVERNGVKIIYQEPHSPISDGFTDVFFFDMVEGVASAASEPDKVIIPESLALRMFGNEQALNQPLAFGNSVVTIGGVYKDFPNNSSVRNLVYSSMGEQNKTNDGNWNYNVYVKLSDSSKANEIVANFMQLYAERRKTSDEDSFQDTVRLTPFEQLHFIRNVEWDLEEKSSRQTIAVLIGIAFILVIIAGINFTNFSMALTPMRIKSINTQKVMGADTHMLRKALLSEAFVICLISFLLSLGVVWLFSVTGLRQLISGEILLLAHPGLILSAFGLACGVALAAGLYPAYYVTSFSPALVLKGNFGLSSKGRLMRNLLIGFQYIASFALIIGASFMYLQNHYMQHTSLGYDKDALIISTINYGIYQRLNAFSNELKSFSGIEDVTYGENLLSSGDKYMGWGRPYRDGYVNFQCLPVDSSFLKIMGIPVLEGRNFRPEDAGTPEGAFIFNERAKYEYQLELGEKVGGIPIIGFMPDISFASFRTELEPMAFFLWGTENWGRIPQYAYVKVKAGSNFREAFNHIKSTLTQFDDLFPFEVFFFDQVLQKTYEKERKMTLMITLFSLVAIFISIVGVFGLVIFESQYRIKEIGIRKVMGSSTREILLMFNSLYFRILVICFIIAAPIGYMAVKKWLENFAYRTPLYWWVFLSAFVIVGIITALTVTFQNWRAANANPVESIKTE